MNRRRWLIALAVTFPLALFISAKVAASWRPVAVGQLIGAPNNHTLTMRASTRYVVASDIKTTTRFDLQSGERARLQHGGIAENGAWMANLRAPKYRQLELSLTDGAQTFAYPIPNITASDKDGYEANYSAIRLSRQTLRINADSVELIAFSTYFRWNRATRALERSAHLEEFDRLAGFLEPKVMAITRDGERVVTVDSRGMERRSTRRKRAVKRLTLAGAVLYRPSDLQGDSAQISPYGALALSNILAGNVQSTKWEVRATDSGRVLWNYRLPFIADRAVFSPDEKWLALPNAQSQWEIRDAQTGALARALPRVPGTRNAVYSPDGQTLYSVANGNLYRQRAR